MFYKVFTLTYINYSLRKVQINSKDIWHNTTKVTYNIKIELR